MNETQKQILQNLFEIHIFMKKMIKDEGKINWEKLHRTYQTTSDRAIAESDAPLACEAGCFYCCHLNVDTTVEEANYIKENYIAEKGESRYQEILKKAEERFEITGKPGRTQEEKENTRIPCMFLHGTLCSIYEYRPLQCRSMNVADKQPCINSFYGKGDTNTPFHMGPKLMVSLVSIALYAIKQDISPEKAFQVIMKDSDMDKSWLSLENALIKLEDD